MPTTTHHCERCKREIGDIRYAGYVFCCRKGCGQRHWYDGRTLKASNREAKR